MKRCSHDKQTVSEVAQVTEETEKGTFAGLLEKYICKVGIFERGMKMEKGAWVRNLSTDEYKSCFDPEHLNPVDNFEEVTEKWKIILLNLGRKTPEFKPNDVLVTYEDVYLAGYHDHDDIVLLFEENLVVCFCPEEHCIKVRK